IAQPAVVEPLAVDAVEPDEEPAHSFPNEAADDREDIQPGDRVVLIVENDIGFAKSLLDAARLKGFKGGGGTSGAAAPAMRREHGMPILRTSTVDCLVIDESAADLGPQDVLDALDRKPIARMLPVVFYGARGDAMLGRWKGSFALREARTSERLLDYIYFFVH